MGNNIDKHLNTIGLGSPESADEVARFFEIYENYDFKINPEEIDPFKILKDIKEEKEMVIAKKKNKSANYFKKMVLGAHIAQECYQERTFGSVKFQKLVYLCEHVTNMDFSTSYSKQAAGPYDSKLMHSVQKEYKKQGWFDIKKKRENGYPRVYFEPLDNIDSYKIYYDNYFKDSLSDIQWLINLFKKSYTNDVELVATIYACWLEIIQEEGVFSEEELLSRLYDWSEQKKKFTPEQISEKLDWMIEMKITPSISK